MSCTHPTTETPPAAGQPIVQEQAAVMPPSAPGAGSQEAGEDQIAATGITQHPSADCVKLPGAVKFPYYMADQEAFVVSMNKTCVTADGSPGVAPDSSFLAMGFPCAAGGGKVDITGKHYNNPQMISLLMVNSCPMKPVDQAAFTRIVRERFGLNDKAALLALYPFELHYWELSEFNDADLGEIVELRSTPALRKGWKRLTDGGSLRMKMYGYENGWIEKHHLYSIDVEIKLVARKRFGIQLVSAASMSEEQALEVKKRCESLRIGQNCDRVFVTFPSN